jgi:hypothetical protein
MLLLASKQVEVARLNPLWRRRLFRRHLVRKERQSLPLPLQRLPSGRQPPRRDSAWLKPTANGVSNLHGAASLVSKVT